MPTVLCAVEPWQVVPALHAMVRKAQRRKALEPDELPFGVASLDGQGFSIPTADDWYAQRDHPWIESHPRAALVASILRRIALHPARALS